MSDHVSNELHVTTHYNQRICSPGRANGHFARSCSFLNLTRGDGDDSGPAEAGAPTLACINGGRSLAVSGV